MTGCDHWFNVAENLFLRNIANPVIWLGDNCLKDKAIKTFSGDVLCMDEYVHYPHNIELSKISLRDSGFFLSDNYLRAKDRCLKMMDRIDHFGLLTRIDRETYFNQLTCHFIELIEKNNPSALVMAEAPHSHAQYLLFEISQYFNLEIAWFNNWMIGPIMNLQDMRTMEYVPRLNLELRNLLRPYESLVDKYLAEINLKWIGEFEHQYMLDQRNSLKLRAFLNNLIRQKIPELIKLFYINFKSKINKKYNPVNPYNLSPLTLKKIKRKRYKNLVYHNKLFSNHDIPEDKFVYFALHYEHERTTNPDGGIYHDQFIAIQSLRAFIPDEIMIVVKEHPSQFYLKDRGSKGRSPLFYKLLSRIHGIKLVNSDIDSCDIQKRAVLTATITGTAALEAAMNNKVAIIFGNAWFKGCPNVFEFNKLTSFEDLENYQPMNLKSISTFLKNRLYDFCIPANQNASAEKRNRSLLKPNFLTDQEICILDLLMSFFKNIENNET